MPDPAKYVVRPDTLIEDVDLDEEEVRLPDGRRLTNELAEEIAESALTAARRRNLIPGRKSLSKSGAHSPVVHFRLSEDLHQALETRAAEEGKTLSKVAREAIEQYLTAGSRNDG